MVGSHAVNEGSKNYLLAKFREIVGYKWMVTTECLGWEVYYIEEKSITVIRI